MPGEENKPTPRPEIVRPGEPQEQPQERVLGLITALLPIATEYVVPAIEKAIGRKKNPQDKETGANKLNNGIGLLQQFSAMLGVAGTSSELARIIELAVKILKPLGLDRLSETAGSLPVVSGATPVQFTITGTGTMQIGGK